MTRTEQTTTRRPQPPIVRRNTVRGGSTELLEVRRTELTAKLPFSPPRSARAQPPPEWHYQYDCDKIDDTKALYGGVIFPVGRYGAHTVTITFEDTVGRLTERQAISRAERYLSQPLSCSYWENIRNDLYETGSKQGSSYSAYVKSYDESKAENKDFVIQRGHCLSSAIYYENPDRILREGRLYLSICCGT